MILKRLVVTRLPGIREPFEIEAADKGIHIIFGPNGIGKSSICRAVEGLYWEDRGESRLTLVSGDFEWDGAIWHGDREGPAVRWHCGDGSNVSPELPPSHTYRCFFLHLRDLVDFSPESTSDIALEIRRQMSGGFDLEAISSNVFQSFTPKKRRSHRNKYNEASNQIQDFENVQLELQGSVDQLTQQESQLEKAEKDAARLVHVERAVELANRQEQLADCEKKLAAMPSALARLTGQERVHVDEKQKQLDTLKSRARELERELRGAQEEQKETGLAKPLERAHLAEWREKAEELGQIERDRDSSSVELEGARSKLFSAVEAVGGNLVDKAALSLPSHAALFKLLRDAHKHKSDIDAIKAKLRLLNLDHPEGADDKGLNELRSGIEALRSWLRSPQPQSLSAKIRARWPWLFIGLMALLAGAGLAWFATEFFALFAAFGAFGAGIAVAALFAAGVKGSDGRKRDARQAFEKAGLEEPAAWDTPAVGARLQSLEIRAAKLETSAQRAIEQKILQEELERLREKEPDLDSRRRKLGDDLGLKNLPPDAELVDFARALDQLRLVCGEHAAASGKLQRLEDCHTSLLAEAADFLEHHGEQRPADASAAKARLNELADRKGRHEKAVADERKANKQIKENAADQESIRSSIAQVYAKAGLDEGDLQGLTLRLEKLPRYRELMRQKDDFASKNELDRSALENAGELELAQLDGPFLDSLKVKLEESAAQAKDLPQKIENVKLQRQQAMDSDALEKLILAREEARASLRHLRDQALFAEAGSFLMEEVEKEFEQTLMPSVFERARSHFSKFTCNNYKLELEKGSDAPRLFATELKGERRRELEELSDGTRAQLLLAARIAFAEEVERGKARPLPLFLDEALDQSDPLRFEAIARSLGCIARDQQRQIFYLTSDPLDVDRIRAALGKEKDCGIASTIDLGRIRNQAASVSGPRALTVEPAPTIPDPGGMSPEEYGAELGIPAFRPALGSSEQHVFYVLWDDLGLLNAFLINGIKWAGQWKTVAGTPLSARLAARSMTAKQIDFRISLLEVFCELWKQGRGKPVGWAALVDSGAVSERYLEGVVQMAKELGGSPERLLEALDSREDERLRGFRSKSVEQLRNYLSKHEHLDERPVLPENELRLRCRASPAANGLPVGIAAESVRRWWNWAQRSSAGKLQSGRH